MNYLFHTPCSPQANGRKPEIGEEKFPLWMPTDEGGKIIINMGRAGAIKLCACAISMMSNDDTFKEEVQQFIKDNSVVITNK